MPPTVTRDYDEMQLHMQKLRAVDFALMGTLEIGTSKEALTGMIEIVREVARYIHPDNKQYEVKVE